MGIFDVFTGAPVKKAAEQQRIALGSTIQDNKNILDTGLNTSLANIGQGFGDARLALASGGQNIQGGYNDAMGSLAQARGAYDPLAALGGKYGGATSLALNALGVNGQQGADTARQAFQFSPGYNFNLDQGLDSINRRRAAGGMLASGNADRDAQTFGAGLASNEYNNWMGQLLGFTNPELAATSGAATGQAQTGIYGANLSNQRGMMLADLARMTAGNYQAEGQSLAGLNMGAANQKVGMNTTLSQPYAQTYKTAADAEMAGSGNLWKFGLAGAQALAGMPGGFGLGGSTSTPGAGGGLFGGTLYSGDPTRAGFGPTYG